MSEGSRPKGVSPVIGFFPPCVTAQPLSLQGHIPHRPWRDIALKGINSLQGYTPIGLYPFGLSGPVRGLRVQIWPPFPWRTLRCGAAGSVRQSRRDLKRVAWAGQGRSPHAPRGRFRCKMEGACPGELHDCIGDVQRAAVGLRCAFSNRIGMFRPCRSRLSCTNGGNVASNYQ